MPRPDAARRRAGARGGGRGCGGGHVHPPLRRVHDFAPSGRHPCAYMSCSRRQAVLSARRSGASPRRAVRSGEEQRGARGAGAATCLSLFGECTTSRRVDGIRARLCRAVGGNPCTRRRAAASRVEGARSDEEQRGAHGAGARRGYVPPPPRRVHEFASSGRHPCASMSCSRRQVVHSARAAASRASRMRSGGARKGRGAEAPPRRARGAHAAPAQARNSRAATTRASTPRSMVGWMTGAKNGEWLVGMSCSTVPRACASA